MCNNIFAVILLYLILTIFTAFCFLSFPFSFPSLCAGDFYSLLSKLLGEREDVVHVHKYNPTERAESDLVAEIDKIVQKKDLGWPDQREIAEYEERANPILIRDRIHKFHKLESTVRPPGNRILTTKPTTSVGASMGNVRKSGGLGTC